MKASRFWVAVAMVTLAGVLGDRAHASSATNINGLYYSGLNSSSGLQTGGSTDAHWNVTYAAYNNTTYTGSSTYTGAAYTVLGSAISGSGYVANTSSAQWITAPGAADYYGGSVNTGQLYLPGNGTSMASAGGGTYYQESTFVYTLAFTISGTGTGVVTNAISISLTIAADDQYKIYVNPSGNGTSLPTGTAAASGTNAWTNTTAATLYNGTDGTGTSGNSQFKIGTNYLVIVVDNTNSNTSPSTATTLNASGLLVYQVGSAMTIDGHPVPEVGAWLPLLSGFGFYGLVACKRRRGQALVSA